MHKLEYKKAKHFVSSIKMDTTVEAVGYLILNCFSKLRQKNSLQMYFIPVTFYRGNILNKPDFEGMNLWLYSDGFVEIVLVKKKKKIISMNFHKDILCFACSHRFAYAGTNL